jgi:hypothetical protein
MPRSAHVGFVVDKVALGQVFLSVLWVSLSILFCRSSPLPYITGGMKNGPLLATVQRHSLAPSTGTTKVFTFKAVSITDTIPYGVMQ